MSFGIFAMLGAFFGLAAGSRHAEKLGLEPALVRRMAICCGVGGLLGAHYIDLFLYQPGWSARSDAAWLFINPFSGISSYGGLIGGTLGFFVFALSSHVKRLRYADAALVAVVVLLTFGRAGCASVHDHVGLASSFALAVDFPRDNPTGVVGPHHDLGLYELALFSVLLAGMARLLRRPRRPGWIVAVVAPAYAVPRFFLDFLRRESTDPRYGGLTPAQWSCIATVAVAIALFAWIYRRGEPPPQRYLDATPWRDHLLGRRAAPTALDCLTLAAIDGRGPAHLVTSREPQQNVPSATIAPSEQ
jgi:phosphatidylglycerol:prolipoprotein diacylglycerol transferase